ncbi:hypothetical protein B7463_g10556, partial [Scytalidium lignicola]
MDFMDVDSTEEQHAPMIKQPTSTEWESKREVIKRLYLDHKQPLRKVMEILKLEHGFEASARMYKQRLKRWGLRKNCSIYNVQRFLCSRGETDALNKTAEDTILGQTAEHQRLLTYMKRKLWRSESMQSSTPQWLRSPSVFEGLEILFASVSNYVAGEFDTGFIEADFGGTSNNMYNRSITKIWQYLRVYVKMLKESDSPCTGVMLLHAFTFVEETLRNGDLLTLLLLFQIIFHFSNSVPEVIKRLVHYFHDLAAIILP